MITLPERTNTGIDSLTPREIVAELDQYVVGHSKAKRAVAIIGIGSGGAFAQAAAKGLLRHTSMPPREIAQHAMTIASEICIYTNGNLTIEEL